LGVINLLITYVEENEILYTTRVQQPELYLKLLDSPLGFKIFGHTYKVEGHQFRVEEIEGENQEELIVYIKSA